MTEFLMSSRLHGRVHWAQPLLYKAVRSNTAIIFWIKIALLIVVLCNLLLDITILSCCHILHTPSTFGKSLTGNNLFFLLTTGARQNPFLN